MPSVKHRRRQAATPFPIDPVLPHLVQLLERLLDKDSVLRDTVTRALLPLVLVNKESVLHAAGSEALLTMEAGRLGIAGPFFMDGVAASLNLLHGETNGAEVEFAPRNAELSPIRQFHADRVLSATLVTREGVELDQLQTRHDAADLPEKNRRVRIFVARLRFVAQALAARHGVVQCRVCARETMVNDGNSSMSKESSPERGYWRSAGGLPNPWTQMPVCCSECATQMQREIDIASGVTEEELILYDADPDQSGVRRVHAALRQAYKRNELAARRMRAPFEYRFLTSAEQMQVRKFSAAMLNVDLALLLACERAIGISSWRNRMLPPMTRYWRQNPAVYRSPLAKAVNMYESFTKDSPPCSPVCTLLQKPSWLLRMTERFASILNTNNPTGGTAEHSKFRYY